MKKDAIPALMSIKKFTEKLEESKNKRVGYIG